jgi:hypothetical protein
MSDEISRAQLPPVVFPDSDDDTPLAQCRLIDLPIIQDRRGNLTYIEDNNRHVPFPIRRVYYLYDVPGGAERGGHAHRALEEFLVAISGSFDVLLSDRDHEVRVHLNRSYFGVYIGPMVWRRLDNFSSGSVCLVLASDHYMEADYYRDRALYLRDLDWLKGEASVRGQR